MDGGRVYSGEDVAALLRAVDSLLAEAAAKDARIAELEAAVAELQARLRENSMNSSRPPSSDGYAKPAPKSRRERSGRRPGGQPGHAGRGVDPSRFDRVEEARHEPGACASCPMRGRCGAPERDAGTRLVGDVVFETVLTRHVAVERECPLGGGALRGEFPPEARAAFCYGPGVAALAAGLNTLGGVSDYRTSLVVAGLWGLQLSPATVSSMVSSLAAGLAQALSELRDEARSAPVANFDETGVRAAGRLGWVHCCSTPSLTLLSWQPKRGAEGMGAAGVLPGFAGVAVHDCWSPYWSFDGVAGHGLCAAHVLRELQGVEDADPSQGWAAEMRGLLGWCIGAADGARAEGRASCTGYALKKARSGFRGLIARARESLPPPPPPTGKKGRRKRGRAHSLVDRIESRLEELLAFMRDLRVPPTNNDAERALRATKSKTKVSGCFRTAAGAQAYLDVMSFVQTAAKRGLSAMRAIVEAVSGNPGVVFAMAGTE